MKISLSKDSIIKKIATGLFIFFGALMVMLWVFQVVYLEDFYKAIKVRQVKSNAASVEKHIGDADIGSLVENISLENDICIDIISADGKIIHTAHADARCLIHTLHPAERSKVIKEALESDETYFGYYDRKSHDIHVSRREHFGFIPPVPEKSEALLYSHAVDTADGRAVLLVNATIVPVEATAATLRAQLTIVAVIALIAGTAFAWYISRKVAKPIMAVNEQAKQLKNGNYDVIFSGKGYREIEELSDTLTSTANELDKVESLRRELIANVSHDLRTPLTLISGYAEMMRDLPGENNAENAQIILDETMRLTSLVTDMLDMSKLQSGTLEPNRADFSITKMCESVISRVSAMLRTENYDITFENDENITINGDEQMLMQALYNLLTNAVNYTGEDRKVFVRQQKQGDIVRISVTDSGEGIPEDELPYIWDRYYKSKSSHKRARIGTGLGLSIVRLVVGLHGGSCGAMSEVGKGSTFWFEVKI